LGTKQVQLHRKHGTYRPQLLALLRLNIDTMIENTTKGAFGKLTLSTYSQTKIGDKITPNPHDALTHLTKLRGIGPATASLLLSVYEPALVPFFSDEVFRWCMWGDPPGTGSGKNAGATGWKRPIKYNVKEYVEVVERIAQVVERLGVSAVECEKVAWVLGNEGVGLDEAVDGDVDGEKENENEEWEKEVEEREEKVGEREEKVEKWEKEVEDREKEVKEREKELKEREKELKEREEELKEREEEVKEKEEEVEEREEEIEKELDEREKEIEKEGEEGEEELEKEKEQWEKEVEKREKEIEEWDKMLEEREKEIEEMEEDDVDEEDMIATLPYTYRGLKESGPAATNKGTKRKVSEKNDAVTDAAHEARRRRL
jgi:hypothetical protein